jgi:hypothetical protein
MVESTPNTQGETDVTLIEQEIKHYSSSQRLNETHRNLLCGLTSESPLLPAEVLCIDATL